MVILAVPARSGALFMSRFCLVDVQQYTGAITARSRSGHKAITGKKFRDSG